MIDYSKKLTKARKKASEVKGRDFNEEMESDRGRAINSAAVRRLQQKTQVFPLETNSAVRSRLTHSLEVQQVGRYIAKLILAELKKLGKIKQYNIAGLEDGFVSAVEISCLLHDIGNPPFGHLGEAAISEWAKRNITQIYAGFFDELKDSDKPEAHLSSILVNDLCNFEGNAQAIRTLHSLQSLNLTYTQLAALIKYTRPAFEKRPEDGDKTYLQKKPGYYFSETELINCIYSSLDIAKGCRHPLAYIMEAADDISYCIADLDDAIEKGVLTVDALHIALQDSWKTSSSSLKNNDDKEFLLNILTKSYTNFQTNEYHKEHAYILTLRTNLVNELSNFSKNRFIENHEEIFQGTFNEPLLNGENKFFLATEALKFVAKKYVFIFPDVESLELKGHAVLYGLLNIYKKLLELNYQEFTDLVKTNFLKDKPVETRLFHKLSNKHKYAYTNSLKKIEETDKQTLTLEDKLLEMYYRTRLVFDYVSGMTDQFALYEFRNLTAST